MATIQQALSLQDKMTPVLTKMMSSMRQTMNVMAQMNTSADKGIPASAFNKAQNAINNAELALERFIDKEEQVNKASQKIKSGFSGWQSAIVTANQAIGLIQSTLGKLGLVNMDAAFGRMDTMERFPRILTAITGDSNAASAALEALKTETKGTAYGLDVAAKATQDFVTRGLSTGAAVNQTKAWMNAVAFYGEGTNEALANVTDALGTMLVTGKVDMMQNKRLMQEGINTTGIYAQATGKSTSEVKKQLSAGEISAAQFINTVSDAMMTGKNGVTDVSEAAKEAGESWATTFDNMQAAGTRGVIDFLEAVDSALADSGLITIKETFVQMGEVFENQVMPKLSAGFSWLITVISPIVQKVQTFVQSFINFHSAVGSVNILKAAITTMSKAIGWVLDASTAVYNFINDNWSLIAGIITPIVAGLVAYKAVTLAISAGQAIWNGLIIAWNFLMGLKTALTSADASATLYQASATGTLTAAQQAYNVAATANPIGLIIMGVIILIVALIVLFYFFTEQIMGALYWLGELFKGIGLSIANFGIAVWNTIKNIGLWFANLGLAAWEVIKNIGIFFANLGIQIWNIIKNVGAWFGNLAMGIWESIKAACDNIGIAFNNTWNFAKSTFWGFAESILSGVATIMDKINSLTSVFGINIDMSGINALIDNAANAKSEAEGVQKAFNDLGAAWDKGFSTFEYVDPNSGTFEYGDVGAAFSTNEIDWAGGWNDGMNTFGDLWKFDEASKAGAEQGANAKAGMDGLIDTVLGFLGFGEDDESAADLALEKDNGKGSGLDLTDEIIDSEITGGDLDKVNEVGGTDEALKYLKDIARVEYVNKYSTLRPVVNANFGDVHETADTNQIIKVVEDAVAGAYQSALVRG